MHTVKWKKASWKGYIMYDSMLLHSQKGKTIETVKKNQLLSRAQSEGEGSE